MFNHPKTNITHTQFFQAYLALYFTGRITPQQQALIPEQLLEQAELQWHLSASVTRISQFHVVCAECGGVLSVVVYAQEGCCLRLFYLSLFHGVSSVWCCEEERGAVYMWRVFLVIHCHCNILYT